MPFRAQLLCSTIIFMLIAPALLILAATGAPTPQQPERDRFAISGFTSDSVIIVDAHTGALVRTITDDHLDGPLAMAISPANPDELLVCSELLGAVERYDINTGEHLGTLIPAGTGGLAKPCAILATPDGQSLLVSDFKASRILQFDARAGAFQRIAVTPSAAGLSGPDVGMAYAIDGKLLVPSFWNHGLIAYDPAAFPTSDGDLVATRDQGLDNPRAILVQTDGDYLLSNEGAATVLLFAADNELQHPFIADDPATDHDETGGLQTPSGMSWGPAGAIYITDVEAHTVRKYSATTGEYLGDLIEAGAGGLQTPTSILYIPKHQ